MRIFPIGREVLEGKSYRAGRENCQSKVHGNVVKVLYYATISQRQLANRPVAGVGEGGGLLPYMGYRGVCHCEVYGFKAVYSGIGYINQRI